MKLTYFLYVGIKVYCEIYKGKPPTLDVIIKSTANLSKISSVPECLDFYSLERFEKVRLDTALRVAKQYPL